MAAQAPCALLPVVGGGTRAQINCAASARPVRAEDSRCVYYRGEIPESSGAN